MSKDKPTLLSLFDGSGGFCLAASMCGITPVAASEIEPYPIAVTRSRFPNMKHLGSVTDIRGDEVEPVDVITFGSPCQDLSVAGKRAGLKHTENGDEETTRSGLFMEAVRIIKEMRNATNGKYPRYAIWENVPGAFSSNKGQDFRVVLEELVRIAEPTAVMPPVPKGGWAYADVYCGNGWSLAYRVLDAQYWGVPQRRRRIYLVADFGGQRAGKISFEREGLRGDFETCGASWQATAGDAEGSVGTADCTGECVTYALDQQGGKGGANYAEEVMPTLCSDSHGTPHAVAQPIPYTLKIRTGCAVDASGKAAGKGALIQVNKAATIAVAQDQYLFQPVEAAGFKAGNGAKANGIGWEEEKSPTLSAAPSGTNQAPTVCIKEQHLFENHSQDTRYKGPLSVAPIVSATFGMGGNNQPFVVEQEQPIVLDRAFYNQGQNALYEPQYYDDGTVPTLVAKGPSAVAYWDGSQTCGTLTANNAGGSQRMPDKENFNCVIEEHSDESAVYIDTTHADDVVRIDDKVSALQARDYKGGKLVQTRYIVRRLTPTECARLQGFPDAWGHIDPKRKLTDEEYHFWLDVRNTHAAINDKVVKDYTKAQMLTWYNKLHTDSSEYKMWGNGIALPCALYVMQGIAEVLYGN